MAKRITLDIEFYPAEDEISMTYKYYNGTVRLFMKDMDTLKCNGRFLRELINFLKNNQTTVEIPQPDLMEKGNAI
jgi:hypothetical protein